MSRHNEDEVPDSEDEMQAVPAAPNDDSSAIGAFSTPSLPAKSGGFITIASESISEFTTSNPRDPSNCDRVSTDISNFTTTISLNRLPTPSAISNKSMLPRTLLSPASLPPNTAQPSSSPPRPKPRYKPRLTDSARSPIKATPYSMPLSPPSTELKNRTIPHAKTTPSSTSAPALKSAGGPSRDANKNPPISLHSSSADGAPPLIDISSSEDERSKPAGKRKLQLITDDECEPGDLLDHIISPAASKSKPKKSKRIETDDEFDTTEVGDERRDVKLDIQVSKKSKPKSKKTPRPTVLSDREDDDELDLIGASVVSKSKEKCPRKPRKPRASKSKKGEAELKSSEFIEDSDREAHVVLSEFPYEDSVQHTRHVIAEVVVPSVAPPTTNAPFASAFDNPPRDTTTTSKVPPHSNSSSAQCPQGVSPTDELHMRTPIKRKTPGIQDDDNNENNLQGTSPASFPTKKKKKRKSAVALEEGGEPKSRKRRKSKSNTSAPASADQENLDPADERVPQQSTLTGCTPHSSTPSKVEDTPPSSSRKRRKSGSKLKKSKIVLSEDDADDAASANQRKNDRRALMDFGDVVDEDQSDGNRATSETNANARDILDVTNADDTEVRLDKAKKVKSKKSAAEQADSSGKATPVLAASTVAPSVESNDASNIPRAITDASTSPKLAVSARRKSEPVFPVQYDKSREASTIAEILLKTGLNAPRSAIKPRQGLSRTHRIASLHSHIRTPPPRPPPIPKAKKVKKDSEDEYDSEEEYELEGLTEKEKRKRREEKRNILLYSP